MTIQLSNLFSDNMVLQRDLSVPVWGWDLPGQKITVAFKGQKKTGVADAAGKWMVRLEPLPASAQPETMSVSAAQGPREFKNVVVGDVWLCSGQSNMGETFGYPLSSKYPPGREIAKELEGIDNPHLRLVGGLGKVVPIPHDPPVFPYSGWQMCRSKTVKSFSRAGYYFGAKLQQQLQVPIGLVEVSRGCSSIEAWMPPESFATHDDWKGNLAELAEMQRFYRDYEHCSRAQKEQAFLAHCQSRYGTFARRYLKNGKPVPEQYPLYFDHMLAVKSSGLYLHAIRSIIPFGIKGVIWYQGETNAYHNDAHYARKQQALIESWRTLWRQGDFPFYIVQVAPFTDYLTLPAFWLQQYEAVRKTSHTGLISTVDIGDLKEVHPKNKWDVGWRLALLALRDTYGRKTLVASGPSYQSMTIEDGRLVIRFENLGTGLTTNDEHVPNCFEVAGADKQFVKAEAAIRQDTVIVTAGAVKKPVYVRYAWNYLAVPNLCNKEGLPAFPFNTAESFFRQRRRAREVRTADRKPQPQRRARAVRFILTFFAYFLLFLR